MTTILQMRSAESSRIYAMKAFVSAEKVEAMTEAMHEIAHKTERETVHMRIITVITLLFLPGTFISVSLPQISSRKTSDDYETLMSTPIVTFDKPGQNITPQNIRVGALKLYLYVTVPLVLITFTVWWLYSKKEARREEKVRAKAEEERQIQV